MKRIPRIVALAACVTTAPVMATNDYPTIEVVGYVLECMQKSGGQTLENMYSCSCRFDKLAQKMPFAEYEQATTQRRFMNMPGERGGVFRESDSGREQVRKLEQTLAAVDKACPVVRSSRARPQQ